MVRHTLPVLLVLMATSALMAGEAEKFFDERSKDFGTVPFGQPQVHHFKITNTTNQQVFITGARVSCGCTSASIPVNALQPGQSTYLTASMDTKRFIGHKEVIIYVNFGVPAEEVTLSVRANRNDNFSKSTDAMTMGQVRKGIEGSAKMTITMRNDPSFDIRGAASSTDYVQASFKLLRRDRNEVVYEVNATMKPGLDTGFWTTDVLLNTSSSSVPTVRLPLYVDIVAPITATPAQVQFPSVKVGDKKELTVVVKGDKPFKILDVKGGDATVEAQADGKDPKAAHVLKVVYTPSSAGATAKEIVVVTDATAEGKITIPVRGMARE
jgi:hypothetical protein